MPTTHDDAFREIQLSGKQVVFIFMAGVVIAVVIFLLGLQVGRGVLAQRGLPEANTTASTETEPPPPPASASQGATAPITAGEKLSYAERLASPEPAAEQLKKTEPTPSVSARSDTGELRRDIAGATSGREGGPTPKTEAPAAPPPPAAPTAAATPNEPAGSGFEIQVAALRVRGEADAIVKRLASKGYPAYVVGPAKGSPTMFRVRVGKYKERREADTIAAKLQKEEQFKPWVVR
jgi:cell division septation protein DedD